MTWKTLAPALLAGFVMPSLAAGQVAPDKITNVPPTGVGAGPSQAGQMYEDVEIMRRLLGSKLQAFAPPSTRHVLASPYAGRDSFLRPDGGTFGTLDPLILGTQFPTNALHAIQPNVYDSIANRLLLAGQAGDYNRYGTLFRSHRRPLILASVAPSLLAEGTWLKSHGVVFALTLPPPARDPRPEKPQPAPKPPNDWDRIRKEVRQEKPQTEETAKPAKEPTLSDVILKVLAENGKHFTQLGPNETLTVAITFRNPEPTQANGTGVALVDYDGDGYFDLSVAASLDPNNIQAQQPPPKEDKPAGNNAADDANHKKIKDLILLAEMHLKQSKTEEAIQALRQALELKPEGDQAAIANKNLAQALVAAQKYDEAIQAIQKAAEWLKKRQAEAPKKESSEAAPPSPLPSKLVISVPKKLLDDVGSGKLSFEEFKKAASVEYLTFAPAKK